MATINIQITAPVSAFNTYADELGYTTEILDRNGGLIPNPETKQQFLARRVKEITATALAGYKQRAVDATKNEEARVEKATIERQVLAAITVT